MDARTIENVETRIVLATDVRFWHRATGAQQRIHALAQHLTRKGFDVVTIFISSLDDPESGFNGRVERKKIRDAGLQVHSVIDDWQPRGLIGKSIWKLKCIANLIFPGRSRRSDCHVKAEPVSRHLDDFVSPLYQSRFRQMLRELDPDIVVIEYVTMAYLLPEIRRKQRPACFVDTHDLLSSRQRQFQSRGHQHWVTVSRADESKILNRFDVVIAIQASEANTFREMTVEPTKVVVAGHPADDAPPVPVEETVNAKFSLGYFGSDNPSNLDAIQWFLAKVWPAVLTAHPAASCLVAGTVCRSLEQLDAALLTGVTLLAKVTDPHHFYRSFQIAINPVQFGTGLKIKNLEALSFGKPLVVSSSGAEGMVSCSGVNPFHVCKTQEDMAQKLVELIGDSEALKRSAAAAIRYAAETLSPDNVYAELVAELREAGTQP